jgi:hypothetical protein
MSISPSGAGVPLDRMAVKVTIAGSYRKHRPRLLEIRAGFVELGADVLRPASDRVISDEDQDTVRLQGDPSDPELLRAAQFRAISDSDFLYLVNPGGYVGPAATLEAGYAYRAGTPIYSSEPPFESDVAAIVSAVGDPEKALRAYNKTHSGD